MIHTQDLTPGPSNRTDEPGAPSKLGRGVLHATMAGFVAWLLLISIGTVVLMRTSHDDLLRVTVWGVAVVVGGLFLVYTWSVATATIARERLRGTLKRSISLADEALRQAERATPTNSNHA